MDALRPGDVWRDVLYHWLAECHAAVILLNREALASTWVRREVNILLWRRALGYPLRIVPAIAGNLSTQDLRDAGFGDLAELEVARLGPRQLPSDAAAARLASMIVGRLADGPADSPDDSPMAAWAETVAFDLGEVKNKDSLVAAANALGIDKTYDDRIRDPLEGCRFLAHQLLARRHGNGLSVAIGKIANFTPAEWLSRLIDNVAATWVDGEAARVLLEFSVDRPGTVVLNADWQSTAEQYVDRATCCAPTGFAYATVTAVAGEAFIEEFEAECTKAVQTLLSVRPPYTIEDAVPAGDRPDEQLFLIVDPSTAPRALVAEGVRAVHRRFPWLVVVLLTGQALPTDEELATWQLADARKLEPALGPREELGAQRVVAALDKLRARASSHLMQGVA